MFRSEIGSGFEDPGDTPPQKIPRSTPPPPPPGAPSLSIRIQQNVQLFLFVVNSSPVAVFFFFYLFRNTAQGTGSTTARIGGILAPYIALMVSVRSIENILHLKDSYLPDSLSISHLTTYLSARQPAI